MLKEVHLSGPIVEDWSFHFIGENYVLRHIFEEGPITSYSDYKALQIRWNDEANGLGRLALRQRPELFDGCPVEPWHEPGEVLVDLGFVGFEGFPDDMSVWRSEGQDWRPL